MNTETSKIVERIDSSIDNILKKLVEEVAAIDLIITMRSDLKKVDSLEKIISMDFKDIAKYLGIIEPDIEVDLAHRGKGIGTKLMSYLVLLAIEKRVVNITLEVRISNEHKKEGNKYIWNLDENKLEDGIKFQIIKPELQ